MRRKTTYERFYIVPPDSRLVIDLEEYDRRYAEVEALLRAYLLEAEFETTLIRFEGTSVEVKPTPADIQRHGSSLERYSGLSDDGYYGLRNGSPVYFQWFRLLATKGLGVIHEPMVEHYLIGLTVRDSTLRIMEGSLYCHIRATAPYTVNDTWTEIPASEYYATLTRYYAEIEATAASGDDGKEREAGEQAV